jgi:hypothetical protein
MWAISIFTFEKMANTRRALIIASALTEGDARSFAPRLKSINQPS